MCEVLYSQVVPMVVFKGGGVFRYFLDMLTLIGIGMGWAFCMRGSLFWQGQLLGNT